MEVRNGKGKVLQVSRKLIPQPYKGVFLDRSRMLTVVQPSPLTNIVGI